MNIKVTSRLMLTKIQSCLRGVTFYKIFISGAALLFFIATILFFVAAVSSARADSFNDYLNYAAEQDKKTQETITPFMQQTAELKQQVLANLKEPEVQEFAKFAQSQRVPIVNRQERYGNAPVVIFVSFSMPQQSLKQWLVQANRIQAPVIVRGLVNNSFKDTTYAVSELVKDNPGGIQIDPTLFQQFHIDKVPAVVVSNNLDCFPDERNKKSCNSNFDVVYGDVTLEYALKKLTTAGSEHSKLAQEKLKALVGAI